MMARVPLTLEPQPEGGFTVTSPMLAELVTEGDTFEEALENARDAIAAVIELYEDLGRALPGELKFDPGDDPITIDTVVSVP